MTNRILSYAAALAEVCLRDDLTAEYELLKVEGPCHDPSFVMHCRVGKYEATGQASKKQTAKQHCAKDILLQMGEITKEDLKIVESTEGFDNAKVIGNVVEGYSNPGSIPIEDKERRSNTYTPIPKTNPINPLGDLIEMSLIMGWPHPRIVDEQKTGPAHDPRFTVSCYFSKYKTFATSKSKKEAKRLAAMDMHENMRYQPELMYKHSLRTGRPLDPSLVASNNLEPTSSWNGFANPSDFCFPGVPKILRITPSRTVEMLRQIQSVDELANPEVVLEHVIKECQFQMHFEELCEDLICRPAPDTDSVETSNEVRHHLKIPLEPKKADDVGKDLVENEDADEPVPGEREDTPSSKYLFTVFCVLRLPIGHPIRLLGCGTFLEDARYNAARKALQYIQVMTLKEVL